MKFQRNVSLKNYTTFRIGGKAKYFFAAKTKEDLIKAVSAAKKLKLPFFILGGGSNLLVSDKGFKGLVIKYGQPLSFYTSKGLEWAAGIPGTVGGAIYGNAGAFKKSIKDVVKKVEVFDAKTGKIKFFKNKDCQFFYRSSIFKKNKNLIIISAELQLEKGKTKEIKEKIKEYLNYRRKNQPLNFLSAGSIFKNYESRIMNYELLKEFPELKEFNKKEIIPAGYLIEKAGLKGKKIGKAKISEKHANFIVNLGGAKAEDVKKLINLAKKSVKKKFGVKLEEEMQFLGF